MPNQAHPHTLDRRTRSFRVSDFTLRQLPLLVLAFVLMTVFSLGLAFLMEFLPPSAGWVGMGLGIGLYLGIVLGTWCERSARPTAKSVTP